MIHTEGMTEVTTHNIMYILKVFKMFKNSKSKLFYRILSRRRRIFTAYSVAVGDFLLHTQ
jgi:hypothetical protein